MRATPMFIRFAQYNRDPIDRVAPGVFQAFHHLPDFDRDDWRHHEIRRLYRWFNDRLDVPDTLSLRMSRFGPRRGVCWFRDDAHGFIDEARYLAWLLSDVGVPVRELRARRPGVEIWRDAAQVVVVPDQNAHVTVH